MNRNLLLGIILAAAVLLVGGMVVQQSTGGSGQSQSEKSTESNIDPESWINAAGESAAVDGKEEAEESKAAEASEAVEESEAEKESEAAEESDVSDPYSEEIFAMGTVMTITAYGPGRKKAVTEAKKEVQRLDALLSTGKENSEISQLNAAGSGEVSEDVAALIARAQEFYRKTEGLFDCTIYPVMELWGFPTQDYHVPSEQELQEALSLVDGSKVKLDGKAVTLGEDQKIDLGGIAKGYTSDRLMQIFEDYGVQSAIVSLGGNVQVLNRKTDGTFWRVGIQDPTDTQGAILGVAEVADQAVITSGGYERYFEENGKTYIHIVDPETGVPVENELDSVTIISSDGTLADALSTSLFIMGIEKASDYWRESEDSFEAIFVKKDGSVSVTEGIAEYFQTDRELEVIRTD